MKKFLSLVLALVMTMSLVTISAGAKDFTDDEAITYDEAVAVISAVKVVDGYTDGSFKPTATLTRGAAAKIICNLILGPTTAAELPASVAPFSDVPANSTFAGYIAYCAKEGIVGGYADGTFKPGASLTGYAFMKMLLGALGYDAEIEGYNDPKTWSISVAKQALGIGLNAGLLEDFNGVKAVTREEAALYAFNTLKATMVDYDTKTSVNVGDATVTIAGSTAKPVAWNNMNVQTGINNDGNIDKDGFVQFAEQYFTKLKGALTLDVFGRPARAWEYKSEDLGTYVAWDLQVGEDYTEKVTGKDLYDLLGKSVIDDYDVFVFVDGVEDKAVLGDAYFDAADLNKNNKDKVGETGDGVLTQVFVNADGKEVFISIINTYLAIADSDYSSKKEEASFSVYALGKKTVGNGFEYVKTLTKNTEDVVKNVKASLDDFAIVEDVKKDEAYLVQVAEGEIQTIEKAEVVADTEISAFKLGSNVTAGGEKYGYAATAEYDVEVLDQYTDTKINLKDVTYNIYLDAYGNLIGVDLVEVPNNYVFITGVDSSYSNLVTKNVDAAAIFIDGTMETIKVNGSKSTGLAAGPVVNKWYTYTKSSDGIYTLKVVGNDPTNGSKVAQHADPTYGATTAQVIDKKHITLPGNTLGTGEYNKVYGNDNTVYLTASVKEITVKSTGETAIIIDDVDSVTTGIKNANIDPWNATAGGAIHTELSKVNKGVQTTTTEADNANVKTNAFNTTGTNASAGFSSGVYTLYKNNGYIIAAVVVGEDSAASKNLVYTHTSKVEMESYDKATDKWTWTRKVISDGEEIEIKEVGDALTWLDTMKQYGWYQVKYNANGEVISALAVNGTTVLTNGTDYEDTIGDLDTTIDTGKDTILYTQSFPVPPTTADHPVMKNGVLYVTKTVAANNGFVVAEDAKIVLIQTVKNKQETTYEVGADALEDIVDALNEKNGNYSYQISAILVNGVATTVVVYDKTNTYEKPETTKETTVTLGAPTVIKYYGAANKPTEAEAVAMVEAQLEAEGYTVTKKSYAAGTYTWEVKDARGFTMPDVTFKNDTTGVKELFKVKFVYNDGTKVTPAEEYVYAGEVVKLTVSNADGSAFTGSYSSATVSKADGTTIGSCSTTGLTQAPGNKSFVFNWTATGLDADQTLTVSMS